MGQGVERVIKCYIKHSDTLFNPHVRMRYGRGDVVDLHLADSCLAQFPDVITNSREVTDLTMRG